MSVSAWLACFIAVNTLVFSLVIDRVFSTDRVFALAQLSQEWLLTAIQRLHNPSRHAECALSLQSVIRSTISSENGLHGASEYRASVKSSVHHDSRVWGVDACRVWRVNTDRVCGVCIVVAEWQTLYRVLYIHTVCIHTDASTEWHSCVVTALWRQCGHTYSSYAVGAERLCSHDAATQGYLPFFVVT
jgi:hypothetical protein